MWIPIAILGVGAIVFMAIGMRSMDADSKTSSSRWERDE